MTKAKIFVFFGDGEAMRDDGEIFPPGTADSKALALTPGQIWSTDESPRTWLQL